ncbi:MAG: TlpA family protein disulfide reductase [Paludibacteraceae bacterium]|nr:TlpA family protein disulfide reductase [Paludibacteraceae bacterium]
MQSRTILYILVAGVLLCGCGKTEKRTLREQFVEIDSVLSEEYVAADARGDQAAMDSIEQEYTNQLFNLIVTNKDEEGIDSLVMFCFRNFSNEQKDSILQVLPPIVMQGEIMQALVRKHEVEKATSESNPYREIIGEQPDGTELKLSELVGKTEYVLLDFWATWCGPCCRLLPNLKELYDSLPEGRLEVLGVNCDEDQEAWREMIDDKQLTWRHISVGNGKQNPAYELYGVEGIPTTILLNREGKIIHRSYGDEEAIRRIVVGR